MKDYAHGRTIKRLESADGSYRLDVVARDDGKFQTYLFIWLEPESGWSQKRMSGLFDSSEAAEHEAVLANPIKMEVKA